MHFLLPVATPVVATFLSSLSLTTPFVTNCELPLSFLCFLYLLHKDWQESIVIRLKRRRRVCGSLSFLFVSIHLQAGESDLFSMVECSPTGENTEVALLSCKFLPYAWIEAGRLIVCLAAEISRRFLWFCGMGLLSHGQVLRWHGRHLFSVAPHFCLGQWEWGPLDCPNGAHLLQRDNQKRTHPYHHTCVLIHGQNCAKQPPLRG